MARDANAKTLDRKWSPRIPPLFRVCPVSILNAPSPFSPSPKTLNPKPNLRRQSCRHAIPSPLIPHPPLPAPPPPRPRPRPGHLRPILAAVTQEVESPASSQTLAPKLNRYSSRITEPKSQGGAQAILYGVGLDDADMSKPQIGISSVWYEGNTCNMHLMNLAEAVKDGVKEAGMVGFRFNTIGVSDAISMGTRGMCYSLQSRDLIADSIETVMAAQWYDGNISIPGCDKNVSLVELVFFL